MSLFSLQIVTGEEGVDHLDQDDLVLLDDVDLVHLSVIHAELEPHLATFSKLQF